MNSKSCNVQGKFQAPFIKICFIVIDDWQATSGSHCTHIRNRLAHSLTKGKKTHLLMFTLFFYYKTEPIYDMVISLIFCDCVFFWGGFLLCTKPGTIAIKLLHLWWGKLTACLLYSLICIIQHTSNCLSIFVILVPSKKKLLVPTYKPFIKGPWQYQKVVLYNHMLMQVV